MWDAIFGFGVLCGIIYSVCLMVYYCIVCAAFIAEEYSSKNTFIRDLIPFYGAYRVIKDKFNSLGD